MADSPFKLFEPYGPGEKDKFFGRDGEVYALYNLLKQTRLALVYGPSGTGKTSLIRAGLPKALRPSDWYPVFVRRGDNINESLRRELSKQLEGGSTGDLPATIRRIYDERWIPVYLIFDQFEEIFTLGAHPEREDFFNTLKAILKADLPCTVVLSMREEYIGHLYDYEPIVPALFQKRFRIEPMNDATAVKVIQEMCDTEGIGMERPLDEETPVLPSTAREILDHAKEKKDEDVKAKKAVHLPYLQIYLHYLYGEAEKRHGEALFTNAAISAVGELGNVLKQYIETQIASAQNHLQSFGAASDFVQKLLDEFATGDGTKQARRPAELAATLGAGLDLVKEALRYFTDTAKLFRADENDVDRYEPVHDVVALQIHNLRSTEDKEFLIFLRRLQLAFDAWEKEDRSAERLLSKPDINKAEVYQGRLAGRKEYEEKWKGFVGESREYWDAEDQKEKERIEREKNQLKRNRILQFAIGIVLVIATVISGFFIRKASFDSENAKIAQALADSTRIEADTAKVQAIRAEEKLKISQDSFVLKKKEAEEATGLAVKKTQEAQAAVRDLQAKSILVVEGLLKEAETNIYHLRYPEALQNLRDAAAIEGKRRDVARYLLEIAYFYNEANYSESVRIALRLAAGLMGQPITASLDQMLKLPAFSGLDSTLRYRYFPTMILVEGGDGEIGDERIPAEVGTFLMAETETTVWQYALYCFAERKPLPESPGWGWDGDNPVVNVSWYDALLYANWLSKKFGIKTAYDFATNRSNDQGRWSVILDSTSKGYRLPAEVEWEYSARGGMNKDTFTFAGRSVLDSVGWYSKNSKSRTNPVSKLQKNGLGLYDMSGNVWEWCEDKVDSTDMFWFSNFPEPIPIGWRGPISGSLRALRGGSWYDSFGGCNVYRRGRDHPFYRAVSIGFRLSRTP
jgi:formylglycine-generating enzyme required for sulfatase activity